MASLRAGLRVPERNIVFGNVGLQDERNRHDGAPEPRACCPQPTLFPACFARVEWVRWRSLPGAAPGGSRRGISCKQFPCDMLWNTVFLEGAPGDAAQPAPGPARRAIGPRPRATSMPAAPRRRRPRGPPSAASRSVGPPQSGFPHVCRGMRAPAEARARAKRFWAKWPGCRLLPCRNSQGLLSGRVSVDTAAPASPYVQLMLIQRFAFAVTALWHMWPHPCKALVGTCTERRIRQPQDHRPGTPPR
jgi:hypothetical protein